MTLGVRDGAAVVAADAVVAAAADAPASRASTVMIVMMAFRASFMCGISSGTGRYCGTPMKSFQTK